MDDRLQQGVLIVKTISQVTVSGVVALTLFIVNSPVWGQSTGARSTVAVIDISYIFKHYPAFTGAMERMKQEVKQFEEQLRAQGQGLAKKREMLAEYKAGSDKYKSLEEEIARVHAQLQADTQLKRKEFLIREAELYHDVYKTVVTAVGKFSERHGISLVLRFNSQEANPQERGSVLQEVNRAVVYQNRLNITRNVLQSLTAETAARPAARQTR